jgi:hypothetical protein
MSKTGIILLIIFIILGLYDLFVFVTGGEGETISAVLKEGSLNYPFILFSAGYVFGHIFSPMKSTRCSKCKGVNFNE